MDSEEIRFWGFLHIVIIEFCTILFVKVKWIERWDGFTCLTYWCDPQVSPCSNLRLWNESKVHLNRVLKRDGNTHTHTLTDWCTCTCSERACWYAPWEYMAAIILNNQLQREQTAFLYNISHNATSEFPNCTLFSPENNRHFFSLLCPKSWISQSLQQSELSSVFKHWKSKRHLKPRKRGIILFYASLFFHSRLWDGLWRGFS